jgi:hypothetical protein
MGKAAKFKKLRKLANRLPIITTTTIIGERKSGKELTDVMYDDKGQPIDSNLTYIKKSVVKVPLNHNRKMKQIYNKFGAEGIEGYVAAVVNYEKQSKSKAENKQQ